MVHFLCLLSFLANSAGSPCGHVGRLNCHSAQHSEPSILSPYRRVTLCFGHAVTSGSAVHLRGYIWGPYVVRQLSCDVYIVIVLRWKWRCESLQWCFDLLHWTDTFAFCGFVSCRLACVGVRPCMTLYHGDLVSSGSDVFPNSCQPGMWVFGKNSNQRQFSSKKVTGARGVHRRAPQRRNRFH